MIKFLLINIVINGPVNVYNVNADVKLYQHQHTSGHQYHDHGTGFTEVAPTQQYLHPKMAVADYNDHLGKS